MAKSGTVSVLFWVILTLQMKKEIDAIMANARAVVNEIALLNGATPDDLLSNDPGRNFIYRFLQQQAILQNILIKINHILFRFLMVFPLICIRYVFSP
mgnify:CR=1 FL=1